MAIVPVYGSNPGGVKFTENDTDCCGCNIKGVVMPYGPVNPNPMMMTLGTVTACGFRFCKENVQVAALFTGTLPQLKGALPEHPDTLLNVGAVTPDPYRITETAPPAELIVRLALNVAVDVGVKDTQTFNACATVEFAGIGVGSERGYSKVNPAPPTVTVLITTGALPVLKIWN